MKPEDLTEDQLNVAVAELLGWREIKKRKYFDGDECQTEYKALGGIPPGMPKSCDCEIPPFTTSLDAMAQAEATLTDEERNEYAFALYDDTKDSLHNYNGAIKWGTVFEFVTMTASQRARAFLRAKGWKKENL